MTQPIARPSEKNNLVVLNRSHLPENAGGIIGQEALEKLGTTIPDVLVVELVLAGRDCHEMLKRLGNDFDVKSIQTFAIPAHPGDATFCGLHPDNDDRPADRRGGGTLRAVKIRVVPKRDPSSGLFAEGVLRHGDLAIHPGRREVFVQGRRIRLSTCKLDILLCLARRPGWVFTTFQLIEACRGEDANVLPSSMRAHICELRKALGPAGGYIQTVSGIGYRLKDGE